MKQKLLSLGKAAAVAAGVAFLQTLQADAPSSITDAAYWPVLAAIITYSVIELEKWGNK